MPSCRPIHRAESDSSTLAGQELGPDEPRRTGGISWTLLVDGTGLQTTYGNVLVG